jgi:hypothetical protein
MTEPHAINTESQRQRRWYQFSLRTLLVLTFLCAVCLSVAMPIWAWLHRAAVRGTVTVNSRPLGRGFMTFVPVSATAPRKKTTPIRGGQYALQRGLTAGRYKVEIRAPRTSGSTTVETLPPCYNAETSLMIELTDGENVIDFDLSVEPADGQRPQW